MHKIKALRTEKGLSQQELAEILGISQKTISGYEVGVREPNIETLIKIAIVLDTTVDDLIEFRKIHDQLGQELLEKIQKVKEPKS